MAKSDPKRIHLTAEESAQLLTRIKNNDITNDDVNIIEAIFTFVIWLQNKLDQANLTIRKLRQMFGFKSEAKNIKKSSTDNTDHSTDDAAPTDGAGEPQSVDVPKEKPSNEPQWDEEKNHGRHSTRDYTGCPVIPVAFDNETLKQGYCPLCALSDTVAKIDPLKQPSVVVLLHGNPLISGYQYACEKARCRVCKTYFTADLPEPLMNKPKYDASCNTAIAINHYYAGMPFYRLDMLQKAQGVPLPDATQYDCVKHCHELVVKPVVQALRQCAALGSSVYFDDTPGRILEQIVANKQATSNASKHAIHATALLSEFDNHPIYLFVTNTQTAGKVFAQLMSLRDSDTSMFSMSDASPHNFPLLEEDLLARWVICLCLAHGRRKFVELLGSLGAVDDNALYVLKMIGLIYENEAYCKRHNLSADERLTYHQQYSAPTTAALKIWFINLLKYERVEPNSQFGKAILYMLERWKWLTQFLHEPGAPLDNNICEQAIKVFIRYRNNSLFYRTPAGAAVGDDMMSLLHTAARNGVNIFDYLNTLQEHAQSVNDAPQQWLPWNYLDSLNKQQSKIA